MLHRALGAGFLRRAEAEPLERTAEVAADLDSARHYLDRALEARDLSSGRSYWSLCLLSGHAHVVSAAVALDPTLEGDLLADAAEELRESLVPLRAGVDDFERALTRAELAGVEARVAVLAVDRGGFARADSLLGLAEVVLTATEFPVQFAEVALQRGRILRLQWSVTAAALDSVAAAKALARARGPIPLGEYPALHRRIAQEEQRLAAGGP
jgi:hypothetical protein